MLDAVHQLRFATLHRAVSVCASASLARDWMLLLDEANYRPHFAAEYSLRRRRASDVCMASQVWDSSSAGGDIRSAWAISVWRPRRLGRSRKQRSRHDMSGLVVVDRHCVRHTAARRRPGGLTVSTTTAYVWDAHLQNCTYDCKSVCARNVDISMPTSHS